MACRSTTGVSPSLGGRSAHPRHRQDRECLCALSAWRSACRAGTDCPGHIDEAFSQVWAVRDRIGQGEDFTGYGPALVTSSAASMHYGRPPLMILAFQSASRRSASSSSPARAADAQGTASVEMTNIRGLKNHAVGGILHPVRVVSSTRRFEQARLGIEV